MKTYSIAKNKSGIVLIAVLWAVIILSGIALMTARASRQETGFGRYALAKTQSRFYAWAGWVYGVNHLTAATTGEAAKSKQPYYWNR
ncbi:MAG: hypothetical protein HQL23_08155, partial [Candidatus Omnitrophica bacterium]|nr:hypothetical protein [Candidatus Omnitrophota bacterium]